METEDIGLKATVIYSLDSLKWANYDLQNAIANKRTKKEIRRYEEEILFIVNRLMNQK